VLFSHSRYPVYSTSCDKATAVPKPGSAEERQWRSNKSVELLNGSTMMVAFAPSAIEHIFVEEEEESEVFKNGSLIVMMATTIFNG